MTSHPPTPANVRTASLIFDLYTALMQAGRFRMEPLRGFMVTDLRHQRRPWWLIFSTGRWRLACSPCSARSSPRWGAC